jgi:hypothetical protein
MSTECLISPVEGREVRRRCDRVDAGALLLSATNRTIRVMDRFAACFHDVRCQELGIVRPLAGKSTLNRLGLSRLEPTRYHSHVSVGSR